MAKNIEPQLRKIGDYLKLEKNTVFIIPEYQRPYSWEIRNCDKLWQDINDHIDGDSVDRYFFGTIIISCEENDTKYNLVDGQQRTTTFLLLLKALLVRINSAIDKMSSDEDSTALGTVKNNAQKGKQSLVKIGQPAIEASSKAAAKCSIFSAPLIRRVVWVVVIMFSLLV